MKYSRIFNNQFLLLLFITVLANSVYAQNLAKDIDSVILNVLKDKNGPGGAFMVAKNGKPIYEKAFGKANIEWNVDLTTESVFQLGSMTKQFTSIAILMLEEQGKLDTKQTVSKYIPDYPSGDSITLHHLLTHTSGIKDFTKMKTLGDIAQKEMTPKMMVDFFKNEPDDFKPGEKFEYNNSGYLLLGYIIEIVSGESYENYIQKNIFEKLGMNNSRYATDRQIITKRAYGYQKKETGYVNKTIINFSVPFASGALMSTLSDMLKWQNALNQNVLLKSENAQKAFTKYKLNNGEEFTYGYGWHIKDLKGTPSREHGGSIFGFKTMGVYVPSEDIYVIGLTNCDCNSPTQLVRDIAELTLKGYKK
ncbi:beta-lactamase family protein [Flavihumibacter rivuli]|uniref:serine hydrolase domain-containing protein n=1 Tax=Flavihumibacter rivuli TaxID=2838156 RepID=UPI001BDF17E1|nr:serine hydrolase domain-containing protein [Flavihumibacter rivuli]ULQ55849.1 beta-lactamase family protein [Flavihumibacter rivuli]